MAVLLTTFVNTYNGKRVDVDGYPTWQRYQCWDLSALKARLVDGCPSFPTGNGSAAGTLYNFPSPLSRYYKRVFNNPNDPHQLPPVGAIIFWKYSLPGSGGNGHTATVLARDGSGFTSFDQNWGGAYAHRVRHNWNYVAGWIIPFHSVAAPAPTKVYYTVRSGDTATKISVKYKISLTKFKSLNPQIKNINLIYVGQKVRVR